MMRFRFALAALSLMAAPVMAQDTDKSAPIAESLTVLTNDQARKQLTGGGAQKTWAFSMAPAFQNGSPMCAEHWTFRTNGTMTVTSGDEVITGIWRVNDASPNGNSEAYYTMQSGNDAPDCNGNVSNPDKFPMPESDAFTIQGSETGGALHLCTKIVVVDKKNQPTAMRDVCWGVLTPIPDAPVNLATQHAATLIEGGTWTFTAPRGAPKGSPVCTESWTFRADGSMTVVSGGQTVEKTWRMVEEDGFVLLYMADVSSTAGIDCMGEKANPADYPQPESAGPALVFWQDGKSGLTCTPTYAEDEDGKMIPLYSQESCWGELRAVPTAVKVEPATPQTDTNINR